MKYIRKGDRMLRREMKEETNHCLILDILLILPGLSSKNASMRRKMLPCTEEEEEALLHFIIISNLESIHYPIQLPSSSFPNFMAAHGVGVAQAKPACKHTIATRKCYQYNTIDCVQGQVWHWAGLPPGTYPAVSSRS